MPPKRSKPIVLSSSSETDEGPVVPHQTDPASSGSGGPARKTPRKATQAPTRNKSIWQYFEKDPEFVKNDPKDFAEVWIVDLYQC